ncbi:MAG TPA: S8 family serine peptidase, partial [Kiritimatiellia bacterium]|nr:S8 family serine peptidase [Kiritimatiellia bacterium]
MKSLGTWLACGVAAISIARGAPPALILERGKIETASASQQAAFQLVKVSARAPVSQRPTARGTAPWIVQFAGALRAENLAALENAGATIRGYVPENALLVEAAPDRFAKIAALADVVWAGEYLPTWKISPALAGAAEARECVATLFAAADKPRIGRALGELGVYVAREDMQAEHPFFHVVLSPSQMDEVAQWAEVAWIEPAASLKSWGASTDELQAASIDVAEELATALAAGERVCLLRRGAADAGAYGAAARAVDAFVQAHPDFLVVAAAGNAAVDLQPADGVADAGSVGSPATAKNVLAVGAAEGRTAVARVWRDSWPEDFAVEPIALDRMAQADGPQGLAAFSGRGPCADGRIKPELVAPGTFVAVPR